MCLGALLILLSSLASNSRKFSILLVGAESFDIAQGIAPDLGNTTVAIGGVTPGCVLSC
jgi:hypothetical protein